MKGREWESQSSKFSSGGPANKNKVIKDSPTTLLQTHSAETDTRVTLATGNITHSPVDFQREPLSLNNVIYSIAYNTSELYSTSKPVGTEESLETNVPKLLNKTSVSANLLEQGPQPLPRYGKRVVARQGYANDILEENGIRVNMDSLGRISGKTTTNPQVDSTVFEGCMLQNHLRVDEHNTPPHTKPEDKKGSSKRDTRHHHSNEDIQNVACVGDIYKACSKSQGVTLENVVSGHQIRSGETNVANKSNKTKTLAQLFETKVHIPHGVDSSSVIASQDNPRDRSKESDIRQSSGHNVSNDFTPGEVTTNTHSVKGPHGTSTIRSSQTNDTGNALSECHGCQKQNQKIFHQSLKRVLIHLEVTFKGRTLDAAKRLNMKMTVSERRRI